jgi:NAD+ kinase
VQKPGESVNLPVSSSTTAETCMPVTPSVTPDPQPTIALVVRHNTAGIDEPVKAIVDFLRGAGYGVAIEAETAGHVQVDGVDALTMAEIGKRCTTAIVIGGDGTMLGVARQLARYQVRLIGINQGRLGFMTDIPTGQMLPALADILSGKAKVEERTLLEARVLRDGNEIHCSVAVNDVVVARGTGAGMAELKVSVDGAFMYNQRSDGLIISTPTGSTAYALSAGGPLLHPTLAGIVLVPIAPHALSNRPIVVPDTSEIVVEIINGRDISVNFDMQTFTSLQHGDQIVISRSPDTITFLHPEGWSYYHTLRAKLHWNEYPSSDGKLK